jgi:site-specific recombinase XerD
MEQIEPLGRDFRYSLMAENRSTRTVDWYEWCIKAFLDWLVENDRPTTLESLTRRNVRAWVSELLDTKADSTANAYFRGLRAFARWLTREGELPEDPLEGLAPPKISEKPVPVITQKDIETLVTSCEGCYGVRNAAIILLLIDTGIRVAEMAGIKVDDVNLEHRVITVTGKGNRVRHVPFSAAAALALGRYLRWRRKSRNSSLPSLWLGKRGPLSANGIQQMLRKRGQALGLGRVHAHRFRHTFAHEWLLAGGGETDLMRLVGWKSRQMLSRYGASAGEQRAIEAYRRIKG